MYHCIKNKMNNKFVIYILNEMGDLMTNAIDKSNEIIPKVFEFRYGGSIESLQFPYQN